MAFQDIQSSNTEKKRCPRCGKPGTGPYLRWVENKVGKRYWYNYFAHREGDKLHWCYLGSVKKLKLLDNGGGNFPQPNRKSHDILVPLLELSNTAEKRERQP